MSFRDKFSSMLENTKKMLSLSSSYSVEDINKFVEEGETEKVFAALGSDQYIVLKTAARALAEMGDTQAVGPLIETYKKYQFLGIDFIFTRKNPLVEALVELCGIEALEKLLNAAREGEGMSLFIPVVREFRGIDSPDQKKILEKFTEDKDPRVRLTAGTLYQQYDRKRAEVILRDSFKVSDVGVLKFAVNWAAELQEPWCLDLLLEKADHSQAELRESVAEALGHYPEERGFETLESYLKDPEDTVRAAAMKALVEIGHPDLFTVLKKVSDDPSEQVRMAVPQALEEFPREEALPLLVTMLEDAEGKVREQAAQALGSFQMPEAESALLRLVAEDENERVRSEALASLYEVGDLDTLQALIPILVAENSWRLDSSSARVYEGLVDKAGESAAAVLLDVVENPDLSVLWEISIRHLGLLESKDAVKPLQSLLEETDDEDLQRTIKNALEQIREANPE